MKRYNKFNTVYSNSRQYSLSKVAGHLLTEQAKYDVNNMEYRRLTYQTFKQNVQMMFGVDVDRNAWVFDQNELKETYNGKESLKSLCETVYFNEEALFLA